MGGRGVWSSSHGGIRSSVDGGGSLYISQTIETRADIRKLFIDELGFKELYGTNEVPTAQLGALAIQLKKSERQFKTLAENEVSLAVTHKPNVKGAAFLAKDGSMMMSINPSAHSSVSNYRKDLRGEQKSGFKTETDKKATNDFSYTARHEYGHLTQFSITKKTGKSANQIRAEVRNITKKEYNKKSNLNPSRYGSKNEYEYFAESFASMTGGKPNTHGKALKSWLVKNKM